MVEVTTVDNPISPDQLGKTLMHEHLQISYSGWENDVLCSPWERREKVAIGVDKIAELQAAGFKSMVDPCPTDMGRDVALMAEVSARTGFNIICATGMYFQGHGASPYWHMMQTLKPDAARYLADVYIREIEHGIAGTGIKPGIIKLATGSPPFSNYDAMLVEAAGLAALATGRPITTHTEGVLGDVQQQRLVAMGVPAARIIVGHSCCNDDFHYHMKIAGGGSYLGFDRFGVHMFMPDETRVSSLAKVVKAGAGERVVVSHDTVWCLMGNMVPASLAAEMAAVHQPMRFTNVIMPMLLEAGVTAAQIDDMLVNNPRRYFEGRSMPPLPSAVDH
jgi:phosphotriesterase-related protein